MREPSAASGPSTVLLVTHTATLGGAEVALLRLLRAIDPARHRVVVACFEDGPLVERLRELGVETMVVPWSDAAVGSVSRHDVAELGTLVRAARGGAGLARSMRALVRRINPGVVHSWTLKAHVVMSAISPTVGSALVWSLHDRLTPEYLGRAQSIVLRGLARVPRLVLANSAATGETSGRSCVVVHPGLPADSFVPESVVSVRPELSAPTFLLLGRISPTKGQQVAIRALRLVRDEVPDARLRIVGEAMFGEDDYAAECRQIVDDLGLSSSVEFVGHVDDPRIEIDAATAVVHASPMPEPFGQVVVEAMARGVPVIATQAGGVPEILLHEGQRLGLLVPPGEVTALAAAMREVIADPESAVARAVVARRSALHRFSIEQTAERTQAAWDAAANS